ncbi:tryptophan--tRNA ligase [Candidatus Woesebacteria bacterium]|nr:tryptophan--tRNA ligase [Candidatus Woesebacteria bacterium]
MKRVLSGIRATGRLHLGNYFGAVKGMLELQEGSEYQTLYMVADAHALTTPYVVEELRENRRQVIVDYLACGLDPEKSILFLQSDVEEHFELMFYFSSLVTIARMQHLPTFKDKVKQYPEHATMALLNYPVLMAADILLYKANLVPVGIDQEPHLEIAREIARKCNAEFDTSFPEPQRFATPGEYIPSLQGSGKMSKSVEGSYITLSDNLETISKRLAAVPTDSGQGAAVPQSGSVANLLRFVELFQGNAMKKEYEAVYTSSGIRYGELKKSLAKAVFEQLQPIQEKRAQLVSDVGYVDDVIRNGAKQAGMLARETLNEVRQKVGLG